MTIATISAEQAAQMLSEGAVLVDIREAGERARERIESAFHLPLSGMGEGKSQLPKSDRIIFHCKSGARTAANASRLKAQWVRRAKHF